MIKCLLRSLLHPLQREEIQEWTPGAHPEFLVHWYKMARMLQNHQLVSMHRAGCSTVFCQLPSGKSMATEVLLEEEAALRVPKSRLRENIPKTHFRQEES